MSLWLASLLALGMVAALFAVAALVERSPLARLGRVRLVAYALGLGVYCTSWTFYGAVGSAVRDGWAYLPIYVGPLLLLLLAPRFLALLSRAVAEEKASTVSDFIAARFGHDVVVARLVTVQMRQVYVITNVAVTMTGELARAVPEAAPKRSEPGLLAERKVLNPG